MTSLPKLKSKGFQKAMDRLSSMERANKTTAMIKKQSKNEYL